MTEVLRWVAKGQPMPRLYELLRECGVRIKRDCVIRHGRKEYALTAGSVFQEGGLLFSPLCRLSVRGHQDLEIVQLVLDLDPATEPEVAAFPSPRTKQGTDGTESIDGDTRAQSTSVLESTAPPASVNKYKKPKMYADRDYFLALLGWAVDAWRLYRPSIDPTIQEIATAHNINEVVAANARLGNPALWPEGMSPTTLKNRLSSKEHNVDLGAFMKARPRPGRG